MLSISGGHFCANATDSRYIAVIYDTIVHTAQQLQWLNFGEICTHEKHPISSPVRGELWGIFHISRPWAQRVTQILTLWLLYCVQHRVLFGPRYFGSTFYCWVWTRLQREASFIYLIGFISRWKHSIYNDKTTELVNYKTYTEKLNTILRILSLTIKHCYSIPGINDAS